MTQHRTINQLKTDVDGKIGGSSLIDSQASNSKIFEAGVKLLANITPPSLKRTYTLRNSFTNNKNIYRLPDDVEGIEVVRIGDNTQKYKSNDSRNLNRVPSKDLFKNIQTLEYSLDYINGERVIIIDDTTRSTKEVEIDNFDDLTDFTFLNITNESLDKDAKNAKSVLKFDLDILENEAFVYKQINNPIEITKDITRDLSFELDVNFPDTTFIESVSLELTDGVEIITLEEEDSMDFNGFKRGINTVKFRLNKNNLVNIDNITNYIVKIKYNKNNLTLTDEVSNIELGNLIVTDGYDIIIDYLSNAIFYNIDSNTFSDEPISDEDLIHLDKDSYILLLYEFAYILSQELQDEDKAYNRNFFESLTDGNSKKSGLYEKYKIKYNITTDRIVTRWYIPMTSISGETFKGKRYQ